MLSTEPVTPGGALTGMSIVIVRLCEPAALGFGTVPVPVMCQSAFVTPDCVNVGAPELHVTPTGHSRMVDHVMQVETGLMVHAPAFDGACCEPLGAQATICDSVVVLSCGCPFEP